MAKSSDYISKQLDKNGIINWSEEENTVWSELFTRQLSVIPGKACEEYIAGIDTLGMPNDRIPQLKEISQVLLDKTGWEVAPVPALINFDYFFKLLANKQFPVATFIRSRQDFDYLQEPDIFHEIFGHCPLLTNQAFAQFTHTYGKLGLNASKEDRAFLARLYWFTVEFGLLKKPDGLRIYGGGILSSPAETEYAFASQEPERKPFDVLEIFRTPYRIDIIQPIYFVLNNIDDLIAVSEMDVMSILNKAKSLGLRAPKFQPKIA